MNTIIIGGGKIGYHLAETLLHKGYTISVIDEDKEACRKFANELDIPIIRDDGTVALILEEAGIKKLIVLLPSQAKTRTTLSFVSLQSIFIK